MKTPIYIITVFFLITATPADAQFKKAEIKIYGLTCSLCSRSVEMALQKLDFVENIETDLETTLTNVSFKKDVLIAPEELSRAVEKAGFSVGYIKITYNFSNAFTTCGEGDREMFTVINSDQDMAAGEYVFLMVEKDLMSPKMYKEYKENLPKPCSTSKRHYYVALADQLILN